MRTRSCDGGLTWEPPAPLGVDRFCRGAVYGRIVALSDGTLLLPLYDYVRTVPRGVQASPAHGDGSYTCAYLLRSADDGRSWGEPSLVGVNMNETSLLLLPGGDLLAVMRAENGEQALWSTRSSDGGWTWSPPVQITGRRQHPGDLLLLANGHVLLTYGNRTPPYRIEGLVSRDGGCSWLDCLFTFSGHLHGYTVEAPRATDLGYPSSVVRRGPVGGQGVTMYYHNPSIRKPPRWEQQDQEARYLPRDYRAIAVTWSEEELLAAAAGAVRPQ